MKTQWFKRLGWFFLPVSLPGVVIALAALAFCAQVFFAVDRKSHSVSDTLYGVFPFFACAFLLFDWVGRKDQRQNSKHKIDCANVAAGSHRAQGGSKKSNQGDA